MTGLRPGLGWTLGVLAIPVGFFFVDRPVARFVHDQVGPNAVFLGLTHVSEWVISASVILLVALGAWAAISGGLRGWPRVLLLAAVANQLAFALKDQAKLAFGRTWPETWVNNNPSYIHDGAFGFHPFHGGIGWSSFPSGHMAAVVPVATVLWIEAPRFRPFYVVVPALVAFGLLGMDYHFVSDILGGTMLGVAVGWATVRVAGRIV